MNRKILNILIVVILLSGCSGASYRSWNRMEVRGKNLKRGIMGGITGDEVEIILTRETSTSETAPMCCNKEENIKECSECTNTEPESPESLTETP